MDEPNASREYGRQAGGCGFAATDPTKGSHAGLSWCQRLERCFGNFPDPIRSESLLGSWSLCLEERTADVYLLLKLGWTQATGRRPKKALA